MLCRRRQYVDALIADLESALPSIWGRRVDVGLFRRRNAEPVFGRSDRSHSRCDPRPCTACPRCRGDTGSESRDVRAGEVCGIQGRRRQPPVAWRAKFQSRASARRWDACTTTARRARPPPRPSRFSTTSISTSCTRCPGRQAGRGARRRGGGDRVFAAASFLLPSDHRTEHDVPPLSAAVARRRRCRRNRGRARSCARRRRAMGTTKPRPSPEAAANAGTTLTTGSSATTSALARARIPSCRFRSASCGRCGTSSRNSILRRSRRGAPVAEEREVSRADVGFEFMLNALRLDRGLSRHPVCRAYRV